MVSWRCYVVVVVTRVVVVVLVVHKKSRDNIHLQHKPRQKCAGTNKNAPSLKSVLVEIITPSRRTPTQRVKPQGVRAR